jgi:hypothetical protein
LAEPHKLLALQGHEARYAHADPAPGGATMTTRALATILVLSLLAVPLAAEAQPAEKVYRIGFLSGTAATVAGPLMYFRQGLRDLGYEDGKNILIEPRWAMDTTSAFLR